MRKKYLSALLFGALVMASTATFTSCKDYDDDIDQVNTDINAVKSDLSSKMDAVNTSISGLTSAQSEIKSSLSAVNKQMETLSADGAKAVAALKDELQKADADQKATLEAKIAELNTQLEEQVDALAKQAALLSAQDEQIAAILADLEATKAQIVAVSTVLEEKIAQNVTDIETLNEITATLSATVDANMAEVVGKITAMETALTNHNVAIESILVTLDGIDGQIAAIKALAGNNTAAIETLKADIETLKKEMEEKIVASHDAIRAEISKVDSDLNARIDKLTETVLAGQATMTEALANQLAALELQKTALEEYKAAMEAADLDRDGKIGANAETIAANKEAADKAIADLSTLLEAEVKGLNDKIDALDERIKALEAGVSEADWQTIKKEIEDANKEVTTAYEKADKALEKKIDDLQELLEKNFGNDLVTLTSSVNTMVTNVAFATENATLRRNAMILQTVKENAATFGGANMVGTPIKNTLTFTQDKQYQVGDAFYIRVSPASATVTPDMISLVNTKGDNLDGIVKITSVDRLEDVTDAPLARATNAPSGIWKVSVEAVDYNAESFDIVTKNAAGQSILFAVSINSKSGNNEEESRTVNTAFDLTFNNTAYAVANALDFTVNGTAVSTIKNRRADKTWNSAPALTVTDTNTTANDDRTALTLLPAVQSENITVKLPATATNVRAMYVTLDYANVNATDPSELQAWKTYEYEGLDEIVETKDSNEINIKVSSTAAIKDEIGFRVFAVNYDGTLVDPDGKAFYVKLGNDGVTIPAANTVIYANNTVWNAAGTGMPTATYSLPANAFNIATLANTASIEWKANGPVNTNHSGLRQYNGFSVRLLAADNTAIFATDRNSASQTVTATSGFTATQLKNVKKVETCFYHSMPTMLDGTKLDGTLIFKDADGFVLATLEVSATKQLPTAAPDGFSVKAGQIVNDIHYAYLTPSALSGGFGTATVGTKDMNNVFNGWDANYQIVFDNAAQDVNGNWNQPWTDDANISIPTVLVDSETQHPTKVQYKYSGVSTYVDQNGVYQEGKDHVITVRDFNTVFGCIFDKSTWSWATGEEMGYTWKADEQKWYGPAAGGGTEVKTDVPDGKLTYATQVEVKATQIFSHNSVDGTYTKSLEVLRLNDLNFVKAYITSNETGNKDYFVDATYSAGVMTFAVNSTSSNPQHEVPSTLHIEYQDQFGHINVIEIPVTILPQ